MAAEAKPVDVLMTDLIRVVRQLDPAAARINVESDARRSLERYQVAGVDLVPSAILDQVIGEYSERYDTKTAENVLELEEQIAATDAALTQQIAASRLPAPTKISEVTLLQELLWRERLAGRTLRDVAAAYRGASESDPLVSIVEAGPGELRATFRLASAADDLQAMQELQRLIGERQDGRQDQDAIKRLAALREHRRMAFRFAHAVAQARADKLEVARQRRSSVGG